MMWWRRKIQAAAQGSPDPDVPQSAHTPEQDLEAFGPVLRQNHIAYVPAREFSGVPGVGTANLAYLPDFLLSAPAYYAGNDVVRKPNSIMIANKPAVIVNSKQVLEGVGGLVAGQIIHQPLLSLEIQSPDAGNSEIGS